MKGHGIIQLISTFFCLGVEALLPRNRFQKCMCSAFYFFVAKLKIIMKIMIIFFTMLVKTVLNHRPCSFPEILYWRLISLFLFIPYLSPKKDFLLSLPLERPKTKINTKTKYEKLGFIQKNLGSYTKFNQ